MREKDREREIWTGFRAGPQGAVEKYGADEAYDLEEWHKKLPEMLAAAGEVHFRLGRDRDLDKLLIDGIDDMSRKGRQGIVAPTAVIDPSPVLAEMRLFKSADEVPLLQTACDITAAGHIAAMRETKPGMFEYEIQALVEYQFRKRGASYPGYGTIVAGGANATVLHYVENAMTLQDDTLLLIDAGAEFAGYTGDVTRAFPVGRKFTGAARDVYDIVLRAQLAAIEATHPGSTIEVIHNAACKVLTEGLVSLGVLQGDVGQLMADKAYQPYYMHRTSHWLGLDVHDVGAYLRDGKPRPLEPGMVLTVEPGLYFHADSAATAAFHGIGIRIEDDVLITLKGHRNLTAAVPKSIEAIEALREEAFT